MVYKTIEYDEVGSTNDEAKRLVREGLVLPGTVITAKRQSAGRGRLGREFVSPGEGSVYASFVLPLQDRGRKDRGRFCVFKEDAEPSPVFTVFITALAAVAVCVAVEKATGEKPGIKWVNDILLDGKKICGILAESIPGATILGIGININIKEDSFPENLRDAVGSLWMDVEKRSMFFNTLVQEVFRCAAAEGREAKALMDEYRARSVLIGRQITILRGEGKRDAFATGIADVGALVVKYDDGSVGELRSGEVSVRLADGDSGHGKNPVNGCNSGQESLST